MSPTVDACRLGLDLFSKVPLITESRVHQVAFDAQAVEASEDVFPER